MHFRSSSAQYTDRASMSEPPMTGSHDTKTLVSWSHLRLAGEQADDEHTSSQYADFIHAFSPKLLIILISLLLQWYMLAHIVALLPVGPPLLVVTPSKLSYSRGSWRWSPGLPQSASSSPPQLSRYSETPTCPRPSHLTLFVAGLVSLEARGPASRVSPDRDNTREPNRADLGVSHAAAHIHHGCLSTRGQTPGTRHGPPWRSAWRTCWQKWPWSS